MANESGRRRGWRWDNANSEIELEVNGTKVFGSTATAVSITGTFTTSGALTVTAGGLTVTAGGLTVTAGGAVVTAGDMAVTAGNYRGGPINAFATTEPTQAVVLEAGTAPSGAITTSSGIYATATALNKIIADGTANTVQT
jgi:hypothetical protein